MKFNKNINFTYSASEILERMSANIDYTGHAYYMAKDHPKWIPFTEEHEVVYAKNMTESRNTKKMIEWCEEHCKSRFGFVADHLKVDYRFRECR